MDEPDAEGEESLDDVVVECAGHACDTAEDELTDDRVVHLVEIELVVDDLVEAGAVGRIERALYLRLRACVEEPGEQERHYGHADRGEGNPVRFCEPHELRNVQAARHEELLEKALAEEAAEERRHGKDDNRERHGEVFVDMTGLDALVAGSAVEGEEEQAEHVERGETASEERKAEYHVVVALECRDFFKEIDNYLKLHNIPPIKWFEEY